MVNSALKLDRVNLLAGESDVARGRGKMHCIIPCLDMIFGHDAEMCFHERYSTIFIMIHHDK